MKWALIVVAALAGLLLLVVIIGLLLPREHMAASRITLSQPPESVWPVVRDIEGTKAWWPELKDVKRVDAGGKEVWEENMGDMTLGIEVVSEEPPRLLKTLIVSPRDSPFGGTWTYLVEPAASGSTVTVVEDGWVSNPIFRTVSRLMGHHTTMDKYLSALSRKFGESAAPEHVPPPGK